MFYRLEENSIFELVYWKARGLGEKIRCLLEYIEEDYHVIYISEYSEMKNFGIEIQSDHFLFPNIPFLKYGDIRISETFAILRFIAIKTKHFELLEIKSEKTKMYKFYSIIHMLISEFSAVCFDAVSDKSFQIKIKTALLKREIIMNGVAAHLRKNKFFLNRVTILDFYFEDLINMLLIIEQEEKLDLLQHNREIYKNYILDFSKLRNIKRYRSSYDFQERPYFGVSYWK